MNITSVKWESSKHTSVKVNGKYSVPVNTDNSHWLEIQAWVLDGNTIAIEDPEPKPPTNAELIDLAGPVLVAFLKAYAQREGLSLIQVRNTIVANM